MQKWKVMKFIALLLLTYMLTFPAYSIAQTVLYVATSGNNSTGNGSIESPFQTIQYAIDTATNGDNIIVMEGKYVGVGNINLDFMGKIDNRTKPKTRKM